MGHPIITQRAQDRLLLNTFLLRTSWKTPLLRLSQFPETRINADLVKKFLPNFCQWSFMISSTLCFLVAKIDNHASTAQRPSFSRIWSEPGWSKERGETAWVNKGMTGFLLPFLTIKKSDDTPVPKLSSPHNESLPASIRFPKNFQPVGVSYSCICRALATLEQKGTHNKPHKKKIYCNWWEFRLHTLD